MEEIFTQVCDISATTCYHRACVNTTVIVASALRGSGARMLFAGSHGLSAVYVSLLGLQVGVRCRCSSL